MTRIFISYSSKDRPVVAELAADLKDLFDFEVWYDQEMNRSGGHKWWSLIMDALRACDVFLYALSPHILKSEPCKREYGYARALGKPVLPVALADLADSDIRQLPAALRETQFVNFRTHSRDELRALRGSIRNLPPAPPLPPNWMELEPPVPHDPASLLFDRIAALTTDNEMQRSLILDIGDLGEDEAQANHVPDLLRALLRRDDVLTGRNLKRAEELLGKVTTVSVQQAPRHDPPPAPLPAAPPNAVVREAGDRWKDPKGVVMVYVPAGTFRMGSTQAQAEAALKEAHAEGSKDAQLEYFTREVPQHKVVITRPFWLDVTPVTNAAYAAFVDGGGYKNQKLWMPQGWQWVTENNKGGPYDYDGFTDDEQPRVGVTWFEADAYCRWRGDGCPPRLNGSGQRRARMG